MVIKDSKVKLTSRQMNKRTTQTDRQTDKKTDRQTDRQTNRQLNGQWNRHTVQAQRLTDTVTHENECDA